MHDADTGANQTSLEETTQFIPRFDAQGLIAAVVTDAADGTVLMFAWMNEDAIERTLQTGEAHFWSRSRKEIWHKGGTSGNVLSVHEMRTDCDQDVVWLKATTAGHGAACHTGRRSCFYRRLELEDGAVRLVLDSDAPLFDPDRVYKS